jgi:hypothetical protein
MAISRERASRVELSDANWLTFKTRARYGASRHVNVVPAGIIIDLQIELGVRANNAVA